MPIWAWIGGIVMVAGATAQLLRAKASGKINAGVAEFSRTDDPKTFWVLVTLTLLFLVFICGALVFIAAYTAGLIPTAPPLNVR